MSQQCSVASRVRNFSSGLYVFYPMREIDNGLRSIDTTRVGIAAEPASSVFPGGSPMLPRFTFPSLCGPGGKQKFTFFNDKFKSGWVETLFLSVSRFAPHYEG